jgi:hypothetical protein
MTFQEAVERALTGIHAAYQPGKQALQGSHREQVNCADNRRLTGSVNLDAALSRTHAHANRWDYGIGLRYGDREAAVWIEVHPVSTGEVDTILRKLHWLKQWLRTEAPDLHDLTRNGSVEKPYVWLATGGINIRPGSREARRLNQEGLDLPRHRLELK